MIRIVKELNIEVAKPNIFQAVVAKQYDANSRFLKVTFVDNEKRIDIPLLDTTKVVINAERKDGQSKGFEGVINSDGTVTVPLHSWMLELEGTVICDISVIDTADNKEEKLTTTSFILLVEKAAYGGDDITSDPQYDVLLELIERVENLPNGGGTNIDTSLFASAIQNTVKGGVVFANDVGALPHKIKVKLSGEEVGNLLTNITQQEIMSGAKANGDGSYTINAIVPTDNYMPFFVYFLNSNTLEKGATYVLDLGTATDQVYFDMVFTDENYSKYETIQTDSTGKIVFTVGELDVVDNGTLRLYPKSDQTIINLLVKPMFYKAKESLFDTPTPLTDSEAIEYHESVAISVKAELKDYTTYTIQFKCNKLGVGMHHHPLLTNGNTHKGEITTTGEVQTVTFITGELSGEYPPQYLYHDGYWDILSYDTAVSADIEFSDLAISEGNTIINTNDYSQVKLYRYGANSSIDKVEYTPNADGTVEVDSLAPYMSLVTDKCGLTINATYNIDTKEYVDRNKGIGRSVTNNFTETDPTVPAWAKEPTKPTYTASEVGALPKDTIIPSKLAELEGDSTHRVVTDTEKSTWNKKVDSSAIPTKVSQLSNDKNYVAKSELDLAINSIPEYVSTEAESVADKILSVRNADTFVMACMSDLHTSGSDVSAVGVHHIGQAISKIQSHTELDLVAVLGDIQAGHFEENTTGSFKYVKECFTNIAKSVPYMHLQGNHDELSTDTTEKAQQRYYAFIGANNVGTITDYNNKFRNYGYRDFENYKVRVIYINTADVSENAITQDNNLSFAQMTWFVNKALNLSSKDDASEWGVIVCGHHPLNWIASGNGSITKVLDVLDAYKGRTSGSVTIDGQSIAYNFNDETAEFICHIHGHLHNFREEVLGTNKVLSITVPNACFNRNNEYGNYDYSTYPDVVKRYGDDGANNDGTGTQRTYNKVSDTAWDTAFSVFCIDRASKTINVFNYGAGIDRQWDYRNGVKGEGEVEPDVPVVHDDPTPSYKNQIKYSINADGSEYIGHKGEDGYSAGYRINSSGVEAEQSGMCCTGFIKYNGETIRLKNVTVEGTKSDYISIYNPDKSHWQVMDLSDKLPNDGNGVLTGTVTYNGPNSWIRITCGVIDDTSILTLNEPIE